MDFNKVEEFIKIAKESGVKELKYETEDVKLHVTLPFLESSTQVMAPGIQSPQSFEGQNKSNSEQSDSSLVEVTSPFVGTFYRSSSPGSDPYIKKGQKVSKGDTVCIVEAMKIMNEIESEVDGEVVEVCVENENYVEYGQVLFRIRPL